MPFLKEQGVEPWYSRDDIDPAAHWEATIHKGLRESLWFLVVLTPNSVVSEWVQNEVSWGLAERKGRVIPLLLHPCEVDDLHLALRRIQWVDIASDAETGWKALGTVIKRMRAELTTEAEPSKGGLILSPYDPSFSRVNFGGNTQKAADKVNPIEAQKLFKGLTAKPDYSIKSVRILHIDDEVSLLQMCRLNLEEKGAVVQTACNGLEGINWAKKGGFDVILLDVIMPGLDGCEVLEILKREQIAIPVILCTALFTGTGSQRHSDPPLVSMLGKPVGFKELVRAIHEAVDGDGLRSTFDGVGGQSSHQLTILGDCREIVSRIAVKCPDSSDLFQTSLHHKAVDMVRDATNRLSQGQPMDQMTADLLKALKSLEGIWDRFQQGSELGLLGIIEGKAEEIPIEFPGINVAVMVDPNLKSLKLATDVETLFALALLEFVGNALDALSGKGDIRITLRRLPTRKSLFLSVLNSGEPIPQELAARIFSEGVTTKGSGRGMGLYIIDQLAKKLGGNVKLTQGGGVQFALEMPVELTS